MQNHTYPQLAVKLDIQTSQQEWINRIKTLAQEKFAARAVEYDRTARFPTENFADLFHAGLLAPAIPQEYGGLGLGPYRGDIFTLWMMTKELAKVDLSMARCWEGHVNSLVLLDGMATEAQKARWFAEVVNEGAKWVAWSGEPQARTPKQGQGYGTTVEKVEGGYLIAGTKVFATSAGAAQWAILLINTDGPGGIRHATGTPDSQLLMACPLSDPTIETDPSWWDPIGMRATASYLVHFHQTFIPQTNLIGYPGQYLKEGWQTCFIPHYAATFLGAAEAAFDYTLEYITTQNKVHDPYVQHHIGQMLVNVQTAHLWLRHVANLWETGNYVQAQLSGSHARHLIEHFAEATVQHAIRACGARSLNRPSLLERVYRDLSFYLRHDNDDHILATIGRSVLGLTHDPSFYKP